ncbi:hypothetical protein IFO69_05135 [Echinicola sp. CAU 1574]|uniref:Uncharacterized protein n=2 Tax=Echinicola arenosa TaxID=2774144 RepID=A0ABR9AHD5_9BACT|nr:hypothetical protein [Echinicola arenosa]
MNMLKKNFRVLERNVLILIAIPLPAFAFAYLYTTSSNMDLDIPSLPDALKPVLLGLVSALLLISFVNFNQGLKKLRNPLMPLEAKLERYSNMTMTRFWQLFASGFLCAIGLLIYQNAGFTVLYAVTLVFVSLGKPTPDRIIRLLKLKGEDLQTVVDFGRREE